VLRDGRDAIIREQKEDTKKRGLASPDLADALACTFASPMLAMRTSRFETPGRIEGSEYNPIWDDVDQLVKQRSSVGGYPSLREDF
jgi:hypothetical protein